MSTSWRDMLPDDPEGAVLVGRVWDAESGGPRVVSVRGGMAVDLTRTFRTMADLMDAPEAASAAAAADGLPRWSLEELSQASPDEAPPRHGTILAPVDLQVIKACGVTFIESLVERLIEESAGGDATAAASIRERMTSALGGQLSSLLPGSIAAESLKRALIKEGLWSQYLEVGIGPDPEVFTKAPVLSSVGHRASVGIVRASNWSNPEPELVLIVNSRGEVQGATLGNDVNLRDIEGRSALLLGKAKDNNASCSIGPFIRLFSGEFSLASLRSARIELHILGLDGFELNAECDLKDISRSFESLVSATIGQHHQYPDGFALFTGTPFAPKQDRTVEGLGFSHQPGDVVTIKCAQLGRLVNTTGISEELPAWTYGIRSFLRYLEELV